MSPGPTPRPARARTVRTPRPSRRQQLLAVAAHEFAQRSFAVVTMDDIGAAAGISGPALYHHFDSKEAMLGEMLIGISQWLLDRGEAIAAEWTDPVSVLDALVVMHCQFAVDDRDLISVHFRDLVHASEADRKKVRDLQNAYVDVWVGALTALHQGLDPRVAKAAVHATLGLVNSTPFSGRLRRESMVALLRSMARAALGAAGRAGDHPDPE